MSIAEALGRAPCQRLGVGDLGLRQFGDGAGGAWFARREGLGGCDFVGFEMRRGF